MTFCELKVVRYKFIRVKLNKTYYFIFFDEPVGDFKYSSEKGNLLHGKEFISYTVYKFSYF